MMVKSPSRRPAARIGVALCAGATLLLACGKKTDQPDEVVAPEVPTFKGVAEGFVTDEGIHLGWYAAADLQTATGDLVYTAYAGKGDGPIDLATPVGVSLPGATSMVVRDLPSAKYRFVVRVTDTDGNEDKNIAAVSLDLEDDTPPEFAGVVGAVSQDATHVLVEWKAGEDDTTATHLLRYRLFTSNRAVGVFTEDSVAETVPGATSHLLEIPASESELWIGVRAVDAANNTDGNERATSTLTPEAEPPVFFGITSAEAEARGVRLRWSTAVDNATSGGKLKYEIYVSETSGAQDLNQPYLVTEPGVGQAFLSDLEPETEYFFIVRAVDSSNNIDSNLVELSATTLPRDEVPPTFAGAKNLVSQSPTSLTVTWDPGDDTQTTSGALVYELYLASETGGQTLTNPTWTTPPGRTSAELLNLSPATPYFVVVRARDEDGNIDDNVVELTTSTLALDDDEGAPTLAGTMKVTRIPSEPGALQVSWGSVSDNVAVDAEIRAHVCVGEAESDCDSDSEFFQNYNATSEFGGHSVFVTGLEPRTTYFAGIRLEDVSGNLQDTTTGALGSTATSFSSNVEPLLDARCNRCHGYTYGTIVKVFEDVYEDPDTGPLFLVDPSQPATSYLVRKLRADGSMTDPFSMADPADYYGARMPSDGSGYLEPALESILIDWIVQGAFDN